MFVKNIKIFFTEGSDRTLKVKKNVIQMFLIKGVSIFLSLFTVPLTLGYVDKETYGIWLTISSMMAWISFFDIGLNHGLKNNLTAALAKNNLSLAKKLVSTTYAVLSLIFFPIMIFLLSISQFVNWEHVLNLPEGSVVGLKAAICIGISYFCIQFILSTLNVVLLADQRPADSSFRTLCTQFTSIIIIYFLTIFTKGSLVYLCIACTFAPLIVLFIFNIVLFNGRYKSISPSLYDVNFSLVPKLMNLGIKFFIIQIAYVIQFQITNFLIMRYYGATDVTAYNISHKYFNIIYMIWGIIIAPLWVSVTDAYVKKEMEWIKNAVKKYCILFGGSIILGVIMYFIAPYFFHIWIHDKVQISNELSFFVLLYNLTLMFSSIFVYTLNGCGILNIQTVTSLISPIVFIVSFYVMHYFGVPLYAVIIASIIANFNGLIIAPIQCLNLLSKKHNIL